LARHAPCGIHGRDDRSILRYGYGLTSLVSRPTARADQLSPKEFTAAAAAFEQKIAHFSPRAVAFLGKAAYCGLSDQPDVAWGLQATRLEGAAIWVLPNPSGRNRAYSLDGLVEAYRRLYLEAVAAPMAKASQSK
jgi:double-stranded uracil-DNA glycosylase